MHFDVALNLIWALVGGVALVILGVSELRRGATTLRSRCRRGMAVLIANVALFPCISASDDLVCLKQLHFDIAAQSEIDNQQAEGSNQGQAPFLALLLESLENFQISCACLGLAKLSQVAWIRQRVIQCCERPLPSRADRAPPAHPLSA